MEKMDIEENLFEENETKKQKKDNQDKDDPVVKVYDVHLSHTLTEHLYNIQFPLRSPQNQYDWNTLKEFRFKPEHKIVEMDFELNTKNEHFDSESQFERKMFTLNSNLIPLKTNYCIGVLRGDQFHITPLKHIVQMRPKMDYLSEDKYAKEKISKKDKKVQAKLITATIQSKQEEEHQKKSFEYLKQIEQSEPFIKMEVFQKNVRNIYLTPLDIRI